MSRWGRAPLLAAGPADSAPKLSSESRAGADGSDMRRAVSTVKRGVPGIFEAVELETGAAPAAGVVSSQPIGGQIVDACRKAAQGAAGQRIRRSRARPGWPASSGRFNRGCPRRPAGSGARNEKPAPKRGFSSTGSVAIVRPRNPRAWRPCRAWQRASSACGRGQSRFRSDCRD